MHMARSLQRQYTWRTLCACAFTLLSGNQSYCTYVYLESIRKRSLSHQTASLFCSLLTIQNWLPIL